MIDTPIKSLFMEKVFYSIIIILNVGRFTKIHLPMPTHYESPLLYWGKFLALPKLRPSNRKPLTLTIFNDVNLC